MWCMTLRLYKLLANKISNYTHEIYIRAKSYYILRDYALLIFIDFVIFRDSKNPSISSNKYPRFVEIIIENKLIPPYS